jgi:hypothetical protein
MKGAYKNGVHIYVFLFFLFKGRRSGWEDHWVQKEGIEFWWEDDTELGGAADYGAPVYAQSQSAPQRFEDKVSYIFLYYSILHLCKDLKVSKIVFIEHWCSAYHLSSAIGVAYILAYSCSFFYLFIAISF